LPASPSRALWQARQALRQCSSKENIQLHQPASREPTPSGFGEIPLHSRTTPCFSGIQTGRAASLAASFPPTVPSLSSTPHSRARALPHMPIAKLSDVGRWGAVAQEAPELGPRHEKHSCSRRIGFMWVPNLRDHPQAFVVPKTWKQGFCEIAFVHSFIALFL